MSSLDDFSSLIGAPLALPPILSGYHGKRYKNPKTGGLIDVTLNNYINQKKFFNSRSATRVTPTAMLGVPALPYQARQVDMSASASPAV